MQGHDTTASGICFTLYLLSQHSEVQVGKLIIIKFRVNKIFCLKIKVFQELRSIFGNDKEKSASYNDFQNMKYLENVIKESMRLYPPVPIYGRFVMEDVEFG